MPVLSGLRTWRLARCRCSVTRHRKYGPSEEFLSAFLIVLCADVPEPVSGDGVQRCPAMEVSSNGGPAMGVSSNGGPAMGVQQWGLPARPPAAILAAVTLPEAIETDAFPQATE